MQMIETQEELSLAVDSQGESEYRRYHIDAEPAADLVPWPSRFKVLVSRPRLALLLLKELIHYRGDREVVLSRPCVYGVFSGPLGGFAPRQDLCVGCLRCTTQYPGFVRIEHNPERKRLGDAYFTSQHVNAVAYEAQTGRIPVKGAGYRGRFGGPGWDGMWTDMSEIVRPTRDGIHGREFISTVVDIGARPSFLSFDRDSQPTGPTPRTFSIPLPLLFDAPPGGILSREVGEIYSQAAAAIGSLAILPLDAILDHQLRGGHLVPLVSPGDTSRLGALPFTPRMVELDGWEAGLYAAVQERYPEALVCLRLERWRSEGLLDYRRRGVNVFHLAADYHGRGPGRIFIHDLIRAAHGAFVEAGVRDQVTLLGSGGMIAAEHIPKAIIAGLDAVAVDTPLLVALQARFLGDCLDRENCNIQLPAELTVPWGVQRLKNLAASWRDQLLEILGAMGLREVRRLRGEVGRAMYQVDLEREAFAEIEGYHG